MKLSQHSIKVLAITHLIFLFSAAYPCTTFVIQQKDKIVFGRNLDWISGSGLIMANPRNLKKTCLVSPSENTLEWVSKFGSITFNQIGRELPYGGINESGLVVEHMTLETTQYPSKDHRYSINANQWIQFQLDNYSSVEEVISSDTLVRIDDQQSKYHFLISDRSGKVATIEFIDGKMVSHIQETLPVTVLANSTYSNSLKCYQTNGDTDLNRSLYNFCTAAKKIEEFTESDSPMVDNAFEILQSVSQGLATKWSIVYDVSEMKIYLKVFETPTIIGEQKIFMKQPGIAEVKMLDINSIDFNCNSEMLVLDLNDGHSGHVNSNFIEYSSALNKYYISLAFEFFNAWGFDINISPEQLDVLAKYPESFTCIDTH